MGAALEQVVNEKRQPLGFFSQKCSPAQGRYSVYDRELLAVYSAIKHFRYMIKGRGTTIFTDHKLLVYVFNQSPLKASPRQQRHLDFTSQFTTNIRHVSGMDNNVADALSRVDDISLSVIVSTEDIAEAQQADDELKILVKNPGSVVLKQIRVDNTHTI